MHVSLASDTRPDVKNGDSDSDSDSDVNTDAATARGAVRSRSAHQNCQFPVVTTHTPSTPLVTACAMTAVHSLPVRM